MRSAELMRWVLGAAKGMTTDMVVDAMDGTFWNGHWNFIAAFAAAATTIGFDINVSIGRWEKNTLLGAWNKRLKNELLFRRTVAILRILNCQGRFFLQFAKQI